MNMSLVKDGRIKVIYKVWDPCKDTRCVRWIYIEEAPPINAICPPETTVYACKDNIEEEFKKWKEAFIYEGGCGEVTEMFIGDATLPAKCKGKIINLEYKVTDACGKSDWCNAKFIIVPAPPIELDCPDEDLYVNECVSETQLDEIIEEYKKSFSFTGGCKPGTRFVVDKSQYVECQGGKVKVIFKVWDGCDDTRCVRWIYVKEAPSNQSDLCTGNHRLCL